MRGARSNPRPYRDSSWVGGVVCDILQWFWVDVQGQDSCSKEIPIAAAMRSRVTFFGLASGASMAA